MSAVISASLCLTLVSFCLLFVSAEQRAITAESGQTATLPCRAPSNNLDTVTWGRSDITTDENVLKYRGQDFLPSYQHPSFKNRVDLQDRRMNDGDVSLVLKDVTSSDSGTYECRIIQREINQEKLICRITLSVDPPDEEGVPVGVIIGASAGAALGLLALIGGGIWMLS